MRKNFKIHVDFTVVECPDLVECEGLVAGTLEDTLEPRLVALADILMEDDCIPVHEARSRDSELKDLGNFDCQCKDDVGSHTGDEQIARVGVRIFLEFCILFRAVCEFHVGFAFRGVYSNNDFFCCVSLRPFHCADCACDALDLYGGNSSLAFQNENVLNPYGENSSLSFQIAHVTTHETCDSLNSASR